MSVVFLPAIGGIAGIVAGLLLMMGPRGVWTVLRRQCGRTKGPGQAP